LLPKEIGAPSGIPELICSAGSGHVGWADNGLYVVAAISGIYAASLTGDLHGNRLVLAGILAGRAKSA